MNTMWIGSLNQYTRNLARQTQWNLKKQSGDYSGHKKSLSDYVSFTKASNVLPGTEEKDDKLTAILTKAQMGKKLSPDEWEYVRIKNPTIYIKLREAEKEQIAYEEALKRCKTRDEAQRLHISKLGDIMTAAKNGDSGAIVRLNRIKQSMIAFTESEDYQKLPTEAELAIEREAERQARQEALREEAEAGQAEGEDEAFADMEDGPDAGASADAGSGVETDPGSQVDPGTTSKPEARSGAPTGDAAGAPPQTRTEDAPRMSVDHRAAHQTKPAEGGAPVKSDAAPALSLGQRAYRNELSRPRRKTIDTKA